MGEPLPGDRVLRLEGPKVLTPYGGTVLEARKGYYSMLFGGP